MCCCFVHGVNRCTNDTSFVDQILNLYLSILAKLASWIFTASTVKLPMYCKQFIYELQSFSCSHTQFSKYLHSNVVSINESKELIS